MISWNERIEIIVPTALRALQDTRLKPQLINFELLLNISKIRKTQLHFLTFHRDQGRVAYANR